MKTSKTALKRCVAIGPSHACQAPQDSAYRINRARLHHGLRMGRVQEERHCLVSQVAVLFTLATLYLMPPLCSNIKLPEGLVESQKLPEALFTPSTKAEIGAHGAIFSRKL